MDLWIYKKKTKKDENNHDRNPETTKMCMQVPRVHILRFHQFQPGVKDEGRIPKEESEEAMNGGPGRSTWSKVVPLKLGLKLQYPRNSDAIWVH